MDCEKREMCEKFLLKDDENCDNWFKSLPENFRNIYHNGYNFYLH